MSLSGIIAGTCAVLTATSAFDDTNVAWMDPTVIETTGCRWAVNMTLESGDPTRMVYGQTASYEHMWTLQLIGWVKFGVDTFSTWQTDNKTFPQDVIDAITGDDTLSGSCEDATLTLASQEPVERGGKRYAQYTWIMEATEWDK